MSVTLLDHNNKPVRDITSKVKKYAGPKSDFHGEDVPIRDMLRYDHIDLKEKYPKIKLVNVIGMSKIVSSCDDEIKSLRIP